MYDFILEVQQKADEYAKLMQKARWSIRPGVAIYYNPEFRCPHCGGGFPTKRLWMVDESRHRILGCWYLENPVRHEDGKLTLRPVGNYEKEVVHPHADSAGSLCMGTATSTFQLLFHGISPGKHHRHTDRFLQNVGHGDCPMIPRDTCKLCANDFIRIDAHYYNLQPMCSRECVALARNRFCYGCYTPLEENREERHRDHCPACFESMAKNCYHCGARYLTQDMHSVRLGQRFCQQCVDNESGPCVVCGAITTYRELTSNPNRGRCSRCQVVSCITCRSPYLRHQLNEESRCAPCAATLAPRGAERCSNCGRFRSRDVPNLELCSDCYQSSLPEIRSPEPDRAVTINYERLRTAFESTRTRPFHLEYLPIEEPILVTRESEVQPFDTSSELSSPESEESAIGSFGVSAEILQEPE